jgi:hypothetical protein
MNRTRASLRENAWVILAVFGCGGTTTGESSMIRDGDVHEPPRAHRDAAAPSAGADATACACPVIECPPGSQLLTPRGGCCPECVPCNYSQCIAPICELGSLASVPPNSCCTECEKQRCPSFNYEALNLCGIEAPARGTACDFMLSRPPPDPGAVTVLVNCALTTRPRFGDGGTRVAGDWELDDSTAPPTLRVVGPLCDLLTRDPAAQLDVLFGCPVI